MEKNPGGQKFWQRGGGEISWNSILPSPKCVLPLKCPPKFWDLAPPLFTSTFINNLKYNVLWLNILLKRAFDYLTVAFDGLKRNETIYKLCDEMRDQAGSN